MNISRSKRSTTTEQYRDALEDLDVSFSALSSPVVHPLSHAFMEYWDSNDAAAAMSYLKYMETRSRLRMLQRIHGSWHPPLEVAKYLKKRPKPTTFTKQSHTKEDRNTKFVLHILGVSPHDNKPFKDFLKAKTVRQKRKWLFKHLGPVQKSREDYTEPICQTRLKRLYHFFPGQFKEEDGMIYFDNKMILYNDASKLFHFRTRPLNEYGEFPSSEFMEDLVWTTD